MATETDWNRKAEDKEQTEETENTEETINIEEQPVVDGMSAEVENDAEEQETELPQKRFEVTMTSDAFPDPEDAFAIWDNSREDYCIDGDGMVMTYLTEEEAREFADSLNSAGHIVGLFAEKDAQRVAQESTVKLPLWKRRAKPLPSPSGRKPVSIYPIWHSSLAGQRKKSLRNCRALSTKCRLPSLQGM